MQGMCILNRCRLIVAGQKNVPVHIHTQGQTARQRIRYMEMEPLIGP